MRRLDSVITELESRIASAKRIFLKIDTQGHDLAVLEGTSALLERVIGIQIEISAKQLYRESIPIDRALRELDAIGFDISGMFASTWDPDRLRVIEFDGVLVRKPS
jgi:hypothetical protein